MSREEVRLSEVLNYGQGYDDEIVSTLKCFKQFRDAYYGLIDCGDNWWDCFNAGVEFDEIMKESWELIDDEHKFMTAIDKMAIAMAGAYVSFDKFVDGVDIAYENGGGFRHKE